jgi:hypothetical protein
MTAVSGHRIRLEIADVFGVDPDDPRVLELHRRSCDWIEAMRAGLRAIIDEQAQELRTMRAFYDARREVAIEEWDQCPPSG